VGGIFYSAFFIQIILGLRTQIFAGFFLSSNKTEPIYRAEFWTKKITSTKIGM